MNSLRNLPSLPRPRQGRRGPELLSLDVELYRVAVGGEGVELGLASPHRPLRDALDQPRLLELLHVVVDRLVVELELARDARGVVRPLGEEAQDLVAQARGCREEVRRVGVGEHPLRPAVALLRVDEDLLLAHALSSGATTIKEMCMVGPDGRTGPQERMHNRLCIPLAGSRGSLLRLRAPRPI